MRRMILQGLVLAFLVTLIPALPVSAAGQEASSEKSEKEAKAAAATKPVAVYRVDYTIREMEDGKVLNSRKYTLMTKEGSGWAQIRVGSRVPIVRGEKDVNYENVGMNIDCRLNQLEETVLLESRADFSSLVPREPGQTRYPDNPNPVIRHASSNVTAAVSLGKPTIIGSMDDFTSNHRFEIEVTVTQVK